MPPKAKFTREEIVDAAFEIVRRDGFEALTARTLGSALGSSPRPVFTVFRSMEEVQEEVKKRGRLLYEKYEDEEMSGDKAFRGSGVGYIRFAAEEPKLFQLFFMREITSAPDPGTVLQKIDGYYDKILDAIGREYAFDRETAKRLYLHMWLYSHGIAVAIATKICVFTEEQISGMLTEVCASLIRKYRQETKS